MSITIHIEGELRKLCEEQKTITVEGKTVREVLEALRSSFNDLVRRLVSQEGHRNRFVPIFVNDEDIRTLQDLDTPLKDGDEVTIFPPVGGGSDETESPQQPASPEQSSEPDERIKHLTQILGGKVVGKASDWEDGPFGVVRLAEVLRQRLTPSQGLRPGRPTNENWVHRPKVAMSQETVDRLTVLANEVSTVDRKVSPMQVAAQLLEDALNQYFEIHSDAEDHG